MNSRLFSEALNELEDRYIERAITYRKSGYSARVGMAVAAACLGLVITGALHIFSFKEPAPESVPFSESTPLQPAHGTYEPVWYHNGYAYTPVDPGQYNLPWPIEDSYLGELCGYWECKDEEVSYGQIPVYEYAPLTVDALRISVTRDGIYRYLLLEANYAGIETREQVSMGAFLSAFYGLNSLEDIDSLYIDTGYTDQGLLAKTLVEPETLKPFYDILCTLEGTWLPLEEMPDQTDRYLCIGLGNGLKVYFYYNLDAQYLRCGKIGIQLSDAQAEVMAQLCSFS